MQETGPANRPWVFLESSWPFLTHQKEEQMLVGQSFEFEALFVVFHEVKNSGNFQTGENDME